MDIIVIQSVYHFNAQFSINLFNTRVALLGLALTLTLSGCGDDQSQTALGTLERDRIVLKATANEIIVAEPVLEGTEVAKGTLLVQLDDRRQKARVAAAQAEVSRAAAMWEQLRSGARIEDIDAAKARVNGAQATLTVAEKNLARTAELRRQNLASQAELDKTQASRDEAEAALETASKNLLAMTNGTRKEELDQAEAAYNAAQAQLELEQYALSELSVTATRDGYLDSLPWHVGERVAVGTTLAVILAGDKPFARVYVPEPIRSDLNVGDDLTVTVDGVDKVFAGKLRWIATEPAFTPYYALNERDRSRLVYLAEVDVIDGNDLPSGVPVQVTLK